MMEPRGALHNSTIIVRRRESGTTASAVDGTTPTSIRSSSIQYREHDEPSLPAHPALEYERLAEADSVGPDSSYGGDGSASIAADAQQQQRPPTAIRNIQQFLAFVFLVGSGVGTVVSAKLQAIPMYNYPNFLNLFTNLLYIPICFAYIVPASRFGSHYYPVQENNSPSNDSSFWPRKQLLKRFIIMGALDSLSTTLQTFAAVYLPGPLLVLLPQAVIPVSLLFARSGTTRAQWMGAATVLGGVWIVLQPVLSCRNAPEFYCEAENRESDCTVCGLALTQDSCLAVSTRARGPSESEVSFAAIARRMQHENKNATQIDDDAACRWLPFNESSQEKEVLEILWSCVLLCSTVPMALSALYKQRAMRSLSRPSMSLHSPPAVPEHHQQLSSHPPALYVSGWIAVFQFLWSILIAVPVGMLTAIHPLQVPQNVWNGMLCYAGMGVVEAGCHPDSQCASHNAALWVHVTVFCHVVYTISMMLVLKYDTTGGSTHMFLALTMIVPLGHLVFSMPFVQSATFAAMRTADLAGLIVILAGLVLYRFSDPPAKDKQERSQETTEDETRHDKILRSRLRSASLAIAEYEERNRQPDKTIDEEDVHSSSVSLLMGWPVENQTSYRLMREPMRTGDV